MKKVKKLVLSRETLRELSSPVLGVARGGEDPGSGPAASCGGGLDKSLANSCASCWYTCACV